jgi:hypothetical protein
MRAVTVTIGRNLADGQLSPESWSEYIGRTRAVVAAVSDEIWVASRYKGRWAGETEDAFVVYAGLPENKDEPSWQMYGRENMLRERLRNLASEYGQESVGVTFGENELVQAFPSYQEQETVA